MAFFEAVRLESPKSGYSLHRKFSPVRRALKSIAAALPLRYQPSYEGELAALFSQRGRAGNRRDAIPVSVSKKTPPQVSET